MTGTTHTIKHISHILRKIQALKSLDDMTGYFYDEPKPFHYRAVYETYIASLKPKYIVGEDPMTASGISFQSQDLAQLKCFGEAVERLSLSCFLKERIEIAAIDSVDGLYREGLTSKTNKIGTVQGRNIFTDKLVRIPARSVFLTYPRYAAYDLELGEAYIKESISTGAAFGTDKTSAILRGVYEVLERDAFMTIYLTKTTPPLVNLASFRSKRIEKICEIMEKYRLLWVVANVTNDTEVPVFASIIIDETGVGPAISIGLRAGYDTHGAVVSSCEEALLGRFWTRIHMIHTKKQRPTPKTKIVNHISRSMYWYKKNQIHKLFFFIRGKKEKISRNSDYLTESQQLAKLQNLLEKKNLDTIIVDILPPALRNNNMNVYKVVIPKLQPLYLSEHHKSLKLQRLREVAEFFGKRNLEINTVPYPF
ncbi:MAG: YcaO-like family protein [Patescibacteria group bacterium]